MHDGVASGVADMDGLLGFPLGAGSVAKGEGGRRRGGPGRDGESGRVDLGSDDRRERAQPSTSEEKPRFCEGRVLSALTVIAHRPPNRDLSGGHATHAVQLASSRGLCGCFMCNILAAAGGPVAQSPAGRRIKTSSTRPAVRSGTRGGAPLSLPLLPPVQASVAPGSTAIIVTSDVRLAILKGFVVVDPLATMRPPTMPTARAATWTQPSL
jgi:hypothetical protein